MVEIRIDTKKDSPEEIRQAITYLQTVIGDAPTQETTASENNDFSKKDSEDMFSMFEQSNDQETSQDLDTPIETSSSEEDAHIEIVDF